MILCVFKKKKNFRNPGYGVKRIFAILLFCLEVLGPASLFSSRTKLPLSFEIGFSPEDPGGGHFSTLLNFQTQFWTKIYGFSKIFFRPK